MPAIQAPLGTYTGWNLKLASFGEGRLCDLDGSFVPFAETRTERLAARDPRPSLEERYGDHEGYVEAVRRAAERLSLDDSCFPRMPRRSSRPLWRAMCCFRDVERKRVGARPDESRAHPEAMNGRRVPRYRNEPCPAP